MKKIIILVITVVLVLSMAVTAYAVTPTMKIPNMPVIPDITDDVEVEISECFWDKWFREHPIKIDWSTINWNN